MMKLDLKLQKLIIFLQRKSDASKFKKELEDEFGSHFFKLIEMELKSFDPNLVSLMKKKINLQTNIEHYLLVQKLNSWVKLQI